MASNFLQDNYPLWFQTMDEDSTGLPKEHLAALMGIYVKDSDAISAIKPATIDKLSSQGYIKKSGDSLVLTNKSKSIFENYCSMGVASAEPSSAVGFRDVVTPKHIDVIQDFTINGDGEKVVQHRILVVFPGRPMEILPKPSLPGGSSAEDLILKLTPEPFFASHYLPAIIKHFSLEEIN